MNATTNAKLEQVERELLDAIWEQSRMDSPEIERLVRETQRAEPDSERMEELVKRAQEVTGNADTRSFVDWILRRMEADERLRRAKAAYVLARELTQLDLVERGRGHRSLRQRWAQRKSRDVAP